MSDIYGNGFGEEHNWQRGHTNTTSNPRDKATYYTCKDCKQNFAHFYDLIEDIHVAISESGVSNLCPEKQTDDTSS